VRFSAPIGHSDFRKLRRAGATYVDKTSLVGDVLRASAEVLLLPRPRRFGKTLNLSMLRTFFERSEEDHADLFEGLAVWESEEAREHFRRYPVLSLTFKDVKHSSWDACLEGVRELLAEEADRCAGRLDATSLTAREQAVLSDLSDGAASEVALAGGLRVLTRLAARAAGEPAVLLLDEYDTPLHAAYVHGYYEEAVGFFRNLFSGLLVQLGPDHEVRSNRESGYGRCDVMVLPRVAGGPGVVLELKVADTEGGETVEQALEAALRQLREREYARELRERGADPIHELAAVFDGKRAHVAGAG